MKQGDYRIFVEAFPVGEGADRIQAVRERYDWKTSQITAPHVTLAGTYWRTGPPTAVHEANLIAKLHEISCSSAFDLTLGGIKTFGQRVVYLDVAITPALTAVRQHLLHLMGPDKHHHWTPHLTLAMRLKPEGVKQMVEELKAEEWENGRFTFPIHELHLMQRGGNDPAWRSIAQYQLIVSNS
ncbi:MAG: 2'-5' RNA ligase family protein [Ardenticatenaceae bacterium]|nr:2'-5' RNA ligase family protein [Ardenticatenaceae bacterium]